MSIVIVAIVQGIAIAIVATIASISSNNRNNGFIDFLSSHVQLAMMKRLMPGAPKVPT